MMIKEEAILFKVEQETFYCCVVPGRKEISQYKHIVPIYPYSEAICGMSPDENENGWEKPWCPGCIERLKELTEVFEILIGEGD